MSTRCLLFFKNNALKCTLWDEYTEYTNEYIKQNYEPIIIVWFHLAKLKIVASKIT